MYKKKTLQLLPPGCLSMYSNKCRKPTENVWETLHNQRTKDKDVGRQQPGPLTHSVYHSQFFDPKDVFFSQMQYERNLKFYCLLRYSDESFNHSIRLKDLTVISGPNGSSWKLLLTDQGTYKIKRQVVCFLHN